MDPSGVHFGKVTMKIVGLEEESNAATGLAANGGALFRPVGLGQKKGAAV